MLQAVRRARWPNRRGVVAEPRRARLAERVATLAELRWHRRIYPRRLNLLGSCVVRRPNRARPCPRVPQAALIETNRWRIVRRPNSPGIFGPPKTHEPEPPRPVDTTPCRADRRGPPCRHPNSLGRPGDRRCRRGQSSGGDLVQLLPHRHAVGPDRRQHGRADFRRHCAHAIDHVDVAARLSANAACKDAGSASEPRRNGQCDRLHPQPARTLTPRSD